MQTCPIRIRNPYKGYNYFSWLCHVLEKFFSIDIAHELTNDHLSENELMFITNRINNRIITEHKIDENSKSKVAIMRYHQKTDIKNFTTKFTQR